MPLPRQPESRPESDAGPDSSTPASASRPASQGQTWTVIRLITWASGYLEQRGFPQPRLEAELLLSQVLDLNRVSLYLNFERPLSLPELAAYKVLLKRRAAYEPIAYIIGRREFYGLSFEVGPGVLIPRPETELLVDEALRLAARWASQGGELALADIGLGSGAIGASLLCNLPGSRLWGVDISPPALSIAARNLAKLGLEPRAFLSLGNLLEPLAGREFHLICANLPYIPTPEMASLMPDVGRHEPHLALDGGPNGLSLIEPLARAAPAYLKPGGALLLEIWPDTWPALALIAANSGFKEWHVIQDLAGHRRVAVFSL